MSKRFSLYPRHRVWQPDTWQFSTRNDDPNLLNDALGADGSQYVVAPTGYLGLPVVAWRRDVRDEVIFFQSFDDLFEWLGQQA